MSDEDTVEVPAAHYILSHLLTAFGVNEQGELEWLFPEIASIRKLWGEDFDNGDETDEIVFTSEGDDDNNDDMEVFAFGGQSSTHLFRRTDAPHPLEWIKNCVGTVTVNKPNGVDTINYIIIVDDSFELRDIEECIPATSDKEYTKKLVLKKVH